MKKGTITLFYLLILLFPLTGISEPLKLVTLQYPPYEYQENGETKGIAVEIIREGFRRMNQPILIQFLPWGRAISQVKKGKADAIFTAYKTPERETFADYSKEVIIPQEISLFILKNSPIQFHGDLERLKEYRFGVVRKVSYGSIFDNAVKNKTIKSFSMADTGEQNMKKLLRRRFHILISNKYGGLYILKKMKKMDQVTELSPSVQNVPSYIAFSKVKNLTAIRDQLDLILAEMKEEGTYDRIIQKFFQ